MTRIRHIYWPLARPARPPGTAEPRPTQPTGAAAHRGGRPGPGGLAGRLLQDLAAAATVAAGHQFGRPGHASQPAGSGCWPARPSSTPPGATPAALTRPTTLTTTSRQRTGITPGLLPRTIQLCIHCRQNPAGFWVSRTGSQTTRRPWCLSCCQQLDPDRCDVIPFDN